MHIKVAAESARHYNRFRYYDPSIGRYINGDPVDLRIGLNAYTYAGNNSLRFIDPLGLAYFAIRPLGDGKGVTPVHTQTNTSLGHEQLFFEDERGGNSGFFPEDRESFGNSLYGPGETGPDNPEHTQVSPGEPGSPYTRIPTYYDDALMRRAVANVAPLFDDSQYALIGNNCQSYADAVRGEYNRLLNASGGQSKEPSGLSSNAP